jgi:hypothetical protein
MTPLTVDLDEAEREHLRKAVTLYYAETIKAKAMPGVLTPSDNVQAGARSIFGKVTGAIDAADAAGSP